MQKSVLWAEDLEGHRQPSLYYLSEDDDEGRTDGPHLICDWNGTPTDFDDIELDTLGLMQQKDLKNDCEQDDDELVNSGDNFIDYPNPAANLVKLSDTSNISSQTQRQNDYDLAECAHLNFLSVPPITQGLLRHIVKTIKNVKIQQERERATHADDKTDVDNHKRI